MTRKIIHIDMDAFFASVEQRDHPELRGLPVAVGSSEERGVVAAASYEARRFGVHSAMSSAMARRLCPGLIFVDGSHAHYKEVSGQIHEIFRRYTDLIEPLSIDEAFLDVTDNKPGIELAVDIARRIKAEIRSELQLVASAGVSYNKFLAKVASDWRKPDGLCTIHPSRALEFVAALPIENFWGVGPVTAKKMHTLGIHNGGDLRQWPLDMLVKAFGKVGVTYYEFARGRDDRPVRVYRERKSVGCEHTLPHDLVNSSQMTEAIEAAADELTLRLERKHFLGSTLTLKIRFHDFTQLSRSITLALPFRCRQQIVDEAFRLVAAVDCSNRPVRLVGLAVSNPSRQRAEEVWQQLLIPFPPDDA